MMKHLPAMQETRVRSLSQEDTLEKEMAIHSSILAWGIHEQRSLTGYSPWGHKEPNTTERQTLSLISTMSTTLSLLSLLTLLPVMLLLANHTLAGLAFLFLRHGKSTWKCLLLGTNSLP